MTLIERIEALSQRASQLGELDRSRDESRKLQQLLGQAKPMNENLGREVQRMRLLHDEGLDPAVNTANAQEARKKLARLLQRFADHRRAESLTQRQDWTRLEEAVKATCQDMAKSLNDAWRQFVDREYTGATPSDLERSLAGTDRNVEQLKRYSKAYADLRAFSRRRPEERTDFDQVRDLARQLSDIFRRFDFDVPEDVNKFLRAVADGGADLQLLSDEVVDWLQEQGTTGLYRVVARTS